MNLDERLQNVAVVGAAGKMGSGIATLLAVEMAKLKLTPAGRERVFRLNLIDTSERGLDGLKSYLKSQLLKQAEKAIVDLRDRYRDRADLVENSDIVPAYIDDVMAMVNFSTELAVARGSHLVFEVIVEEETAKVDLYRELAALTGPDTFFLTNTSSIAIGSLDERAGLGGRLVGCHFYNPPVVQKLVEVIASKHTRKDLAELTLELGKRMRKTLIPSNDIAGFIGNGHFTRDGLHAMTRVAELAVEHGFAGAVYLENRITQDWLLRPMGIFQLVDYVGVNVFHCILKVMREQLGDATLTSPLCDELLALGVIGGQHPDGSQKDGILKYERGKPTAVYDPQKKAYVPFDEVRAAMDDLLGPLPQGFVPWKGLVSDRAKTDKLKAHFDAVKATDSFGAREALSFLRRTKEIGEQLVSDGVARAEADVNTVLTDGFFWLYGPIHPYTD